MSFMIFSEENPLDLVSNLSFLSHVESVRHLTHGLPPNMTGEKEKAALICCAIDALRSGADSIAKLL